MLTSRHAFRLAAILLLAACLQGAAFATLKLPRIFGSGMVLQRDEPVRVWGWADAGQPVTVSFAGQTKTATAAGDGKWALTLDPLPASAENRTLEASSGTDKIAFENVLVGEVWLCSGQSNMEWPVSASGGGAETAAAATNPLIRHFKARLAVAATPQTDQEGEWTIASPGTVPSFTAVGYNFALSIFEHTQVPFGIVNSSWGGSRIEPWIDAQGFAGYDELKDIVAQLADVDGLWNKARLARLDEIDAWSKATRDAVQNNTAQPAFPGILPEHPFKLNTTPTSIYNQMIAPLVGYNVRGVLWYQGESNNGEAMLYATKMQALIASWRRLWERPELPFYFVQLAPYTYGQPEMLPGIWEAQTAVMQADPHTGMAIINDIATVGDIHPPNKTDVGKRLARWALKNEYGVKDIETSGPIFKSAKFSKDKVTISFDHAEGLKTRDGAAPTWFEIAGADGSFVPAQAQIEGKKLVLSAEGLAEPTAVRFAWSEIAEPNLSNGAGLPAGAFRAKRDE